MTSRRAFLTGMLATGLLPAPSWADVGSPALLAAARRQNGQHVIVGLSDQGHILFESPIPGRGHAAAAHPQRPEILAFARRPGQFADVIDCRTGKRQSRLLPPQGRHFYGHGCFAQNGRYLLTTENDYEAARGVVGVWDAADGYARVTEFFSGGVGPHDILLHSDQVLVVANGGIETHPDSGRTKLNLPTMRSNLSYLGLDGALIEQHALPTELQLNSIRHLTRAQDGRIGFAMQWQGAVGELVPIVGTHAPGEQLHLLGGEDPRVLNLSGYGGSVSFSPDGSRIGVTSPRGDMLQIYDSKAATLVEAHALQDVCGLAWHGDGFVASTGRGRLLHPGFSGGLNREFPDLAWDNHLIALTD
jgi:hypothetical protein